MRRLDYVIERKRMDDLAGSTRREPFNSTPMAVNSISPGPPHVRCAPMWALSTCGEPDEIKKNTHPRHTAALVREQASLTGASKSRSTRLEKEAVTFSRVGILLDFVRRSGTTRAEGPHVGPQHVRRAKRDRIDRRVWVTLPLSSRYRFRSAGIKHGVYLVLYAARSGESSLSDHTGLTTTLGAI